MANLLSTSITGTLSTTGYTQLYAGNLGNSPRLIFGSETSSTDKSIFLESYYMVFQGHNNEGFKFQTTDAGGTAYNRVTILGSGNVGIGTASPGAKLTVGDDNSNVAELRVLRSNSLSSTYAYIKTTGGTSEFGGTGDARLRADGSSILSFYTNSSEAMRITSAGNVGIGTTSPTSMLHIDADAVGDTTQLMVSNRNASGGASIQIDRGSNLRASQILHTLSGAAGWYQGVLRRGGGVNNNFSIGTGDDISSTTPVLHLTTSGNVGIGTTSPAVALHVDASGGGIVRVSRIGAGAGVLQMEADGTNGTLAATNAMIFNTNSSERLRITSAGVVGIGTTSPSGLFEVKGDGVSYFTRGTKSILLNPNVVGQDTNALIDTSTGMALAFGTAGSERVRITTDGTLQVGTTSQTYNNATYGYVASFKGAVSSQAYISVALSNQASTSEGMLFGLSSSTGDIYVLDNKPLVFYTNGNEKMRITAAGNVGIGTTAPQYALDVAQVIRSNYGSYEGGLYLGSTPAGVAYAAGAVKAAPSPSYSYTGKLSFYVTTWGVGSDYGITEQMYIETSAADTKAANIVMLPWGGNVGIGTTSPGAKLHVSDANYSISSGDAYNLTVITTTPQSPGRGGTIGLGGEAGDGGFVYGAIQGAKENITFANKAGYLAFYTRSDGSNPGERMRITSTGNVGIGTTSPTFTLSVQGVAQARGGVYVTQASPTNTLVLDADTTSLHKIYTNASVDLSLGTNASTSQLYLKNGGNIGINYTAPDSSLHVSSSGANAYSSTITRQTNMKGIINTLSNNDDDMVGIYFATGSAIGTHWSGITGSRSQNAVDWSTQLNFYTHDENTSNLNDATQKMVIKGNGNVGIGTTTPSGKLHVYGGSFITDLDATYHQGILNEYVSAYVTRTKFGRWNTTSNLEIYYDIAGTEEARITRNYSVAVLKFDRGGTTDMIINGSGNVGIGTTAPAEKLVVNASSGANSIIYAATDTGQAGLKLLAGTGSTNRATRLDFLNGVASGTVPRWTLINDYNQNGTNDFRFVKDDQATSVLTLLQNGNVLIGTTSDSGYKLRVSGNSYQDGAATFATSLYVGTNQTINGTTPLIFTGNGNGSTYTQTAIYANLNNTSGSTSNGIFIERGRLTDSPSSEIRHFIIGSRGGEIQWQIDGNGKTIQSGDLTLRGGNRYILGDGGDLYIDTENVSGRDILLQTQSGQKVGINTTAPSEKLDVSGNIKASDTIYAPSILVNNHSDNTKGYRIHTTSGVSVSAMFTNSSNYLVIGAGAFARINLNKDVHINGVSLGVGSIAPSGTAGRIDASNDIVAFNSSDERLKENITPIENALEKVKSLTGVEFDWKPEHKDAHGHEGHDTGVIAQQVQEVMPTAVRTNDTGFLAVRYEKLIALLIESNKELAARVELLEEKLKQ